MSAPPKAGPPDRAPTSAFLRNCWYVAGWTREFESGKLHARTIINEPLVLYRRQDGGLVAMEDRCVHRHAALSLGCLEGDAVRCMYHGFKFAHSGECVEIPGQESVPSQARVRTFPLIEKHSWAWVWMGDPARADESLIPPAVSLDDPNWVFNSGSLDYVANHQLISDNLTDLSHLSYAHKDSFIAGPHWILSPAVVAEVPRGVHVSRWVRDDPTPPYVPSHSESLVDQLIEYDYLLPGVFLLHSAVYPVGTADRIKEGGTPPSALFETFTCQAVTPMTPTTTRYFFSWGPAARLGGGKQQADIMWGMAQKAFNEDKIIIEAQQRIILFDPHRPILATRADLAAVKFERLVARLIHEESSSRLPAAAAR